LKLLRECVIVARVGLATLRTRLGRSLVIVISMACVTGVLLSMLSMADGLQHAYGRGGDERLTIVTSLAANDEHFSGLSRSDIATILNGPGIAKTPDGSLLASAEISQYIRPLEVSSGSGFRLRGVGAMGTALRPQFRIVAGRMFRAGARELIAGIGVGRISSGNIGDTVLLRDGEWRVVGIFSAGGNLAESEVIGDVDTIMTAMRAKAFNTVLVQLQSPQSLEPFNRWLKENPALKVKADNQTEFYLRLYTGQTIRFFQSIAYVLSAVLAIGALFGTVKLHYSGVRARTRELATLRAIGYGPLPVAASVMFESIVLSLAGAILGAGIAWLIFDGRTTSYQQDVFQLTISTASLALGAGWALMLALLGGALPATRAASLPVAHALRTV
jgi:putative ABC transport system permease protein